MAFICFDGAITDASTSIFTAQNRGFRYGDGLFETIKIFKGKILLEQFHFERVFFGLDVLSINFESISQQQLVSQIKNLCSLNNCSASARVRLALYRNEDHTASYLIEAWPLSPQANKLSEEGWKIDVYPYARKSCDIFSNLKSANYLPCVMADIFARKNDLDECLLLNYENNICEASKANIFLVVKDEVYTPALHQGCVNGVQRRFVIDALKTLGKRVHQKEISEQLLLNADEVFLTNAINDVRWVQSYKQKKFCNDFITAFYKKVFSTIYD